MSSHGQLLKSSISFSGTVEVETRFEKRWEAMPSHEPCCSHPSVQEGTPLFQRGGGQSPLGIVVEVVEKAVARL